MQKTHTIEDLRLAHEELLYLKSDAYLDSKLSLLREKLERYCQLIIWGDKNNCLFFEQFWEMKGLSVLFDLFVRSRSRQVNIMALDYINKLLINISDEGSQYLLLSSSTIANMQTIRFVKMSVDLAQFYINFLKSLAAKMNEHTVHLFFNQVRKSEMQKHPNFPLAWQSVRFVNHPQSLVRTTCSNIFPSIFKLRDSRVTQYLKRFPFVVYYVHYCSVLRDCWSSIDAAVRQNAQNALRQMFDNHLDQYTYLQEMMNISEQTVSECFFNAFVSQCLSTVVKSLFDKPFYDPKSILLIVGSIFRSVQRENIANIVTLVLLGRYAFTHLTGRLLEYCPLCSYNHNWSFKNYWDEHEQYIQKACSELFVKADILPDSRIMTPQSIKEKSDVQTTRSAESEKSQSNVSFISLFGSDFGRLEVEMLKLAKVFGLLHEGKKRASPAELFAIILAQLKCNKIQDTKELMQNKAKDSIISLLTSADEGISYLIIDLFQNVITKKVSQPILLFSGLDVNFRQADTYSREFQNTLLTTCLQNFQRSRNYHVITLYKSMEFIKTLVGDKTFYDLKPFQLLFAEKYQEAIDRIKQEYMYKGQNWDRVVMGYLNCVKVLKETCQGSSRVMDHYFKITNNKPQIDEITYDFSVFSLLNEVRYKVFPSKWPQQGRFQFGRMNLKCMPTETEVRQPFLECSYKSMNEEKFNVGWLMLNKTSLAVLEKVDSGNRVGDIVLSLDPMQIVCILDKSDPRRLIMSGDTRQQGLSIMVKDSRMAINIREEIEQAKKNLFRLGFTQLVSHIQKCSQDTIK